MSAAALVMMDLHAHLCINEVIGFMGGVCDIEKRSITVQRVRHFGAAPSRARSASRRVGLSSEEFSDSVQIPSRMPAVDVVSRERAHGSDRG